MTKALLDRTVLVTGAGRGIGREIALLCAREGAAVIVNDFGGSASGSGQSAAPAQEVVSEIQAAGGRAFANYASVSDPDGAQSIIDDAVREFGRVDAVINNAGFLRDAIFHKMSIADWRAVVDVHLNGYFYVSKAAARYFKEQGSGSYVHFTSTSGLIGNFGQANYSAAKMGVVGLSNSIALDMRRFGVRSNCVAPFAWSRMTATIPAETEAERLRVERFMSMSADKVAPLVAYLCADASASISGQIFCVRKNEILLFSRPMPIRSAHRSDGWTIESIRDEVDPMMRSSYQKLQRSSDVFVWDPI